MRPKKRLSKGCSRNGSDRATNKKGRSRRPIGDIMQWSAKCREHFFPWRSRAGDILKAQSIAEAGLTECHPGYRLERSAPRFHLLLYPMEGTGEVFDQERILAVRPGELLIAPAAKPFGYYPKGKIWRFMWFHLSDDNVWGFLRNMPLTVRQTVLMQPIWKCTEEFLRESRGRTESHREACSLQSRLISLYIKRELGSGRGEDVETGNRLDHLRSVIESDLRREWNVETLAKTLGVSCSHLHRLTRGHFNMSPMKLVTRLRMERAQEWLIMYDAPQRVIGEMVGYSDEFAFLVAFKRFSGVTPKQFRKWR